MTSLLLKAYTHMCTSSAMTRVYEEQKALCPYVHSTSRGHEAIQLAMGMQLLPCDYVSPYYRDESMMLGMGYELYTLMLQLLAKGDDIFTGGRAYYNHPNSRAADKPQIIHQSSATGMQAIPTTGIAQGIKFLERTNSPLFIRGKNGELPIVVCSLGDASVTEGEVSEAFQFAALHALPIIFLVQDNDWGISVSKEEARTNTAYEFIKGFTGIERISIDGSAFEECYDRVKEVIADVRLKRRPWLIHARVPLLGHHTSGVRKEFYRTEEDLKQHAKNDPILKLKTHLINSGFAEEALEKIAEEANEHVEKAFQNALAAAEPDTKTISEHIFAPTTITEEKGDRSPAGREKILMVDAALFAIREIMETYPEAVLYGQDVGRRLGGVFREAATLAEQFGDHRVFNTAIQEAYIVGSTIGMSAVGLKPIVEIQFADYIYPGLNQLVTEISKSCYLSCGKFPVQALIRVPIGAYGGGGPYHSGSIESLLLTIKGIKVVYPSNAADMKGLMKAAFLDPNPVIMLEHKGLYWSKVPGTSDARRSEPAKDYILPLGKGAVILQAEKNKEESGETCVIVTYGMGVYWAVDAAKQFPGSVEVIDLRSLFPLDEALVFDAVKRHGKCLVLTEEQQNNSFAESFAARINNTCFQYLDAPVEVLGALDLPAVPMNKILEQTMLPNAQKVAKKISSLLNY